MGIDWLVKRGQNGAIINVMYKYMIDYHCKKVWKKITLHL